MRFRWAVHVGRELAESLVEVVHLREDTAYGDDYKDVSRGVRKLVVPGKGHLERNAECLDGHDGDGAGCGADGQVNERVLLAMLGRNVVNHENGEGGDEDAVDEEACRLVRLEACRCSFASGVRIPGWMA